jgi:hypothetical protein
MKKRAKLSRPNELKWDNLTNTWKGTWVDQQIAKADRATDRYQSNIEKTQ